MPLTPFQQANFRAHLHDIDQIIDNDGNPLVAGGSGGPTNVYVQGTDPGAVGAGKLWVNTADDPPSLHIRSSDDASWIEVSSGDLTSLTPVAVSAADQDVNLSGEAIPIKGLLRIDMVAMTQSRVITLPSTVENTLLVLVTNSDGSCSPTNWIGIAFSGGEQVADAAGDVQSTLTLIDPYASILIARAGGIF